MENQYFACWGVTVADVVGDLAMLHGGQRGITLKNTSQNDPQKILDHGSKEVSKYDEGLGLGIFGNLFGTRALLRLKVVILRLEISKNYDDLRKLRL